MSDILRNFLDGCFSEVGAKGVNVTGMPRSRLRNAIGEIVICDGFEQTPELRQFPDIRAGLIDSTFKMIVLRGGTASIGIAVTLPTGKSGTINWGDGSTTTLTASGAAVNYYHTWTTWSTSSNGLEEYNVVTVSGEVTAISAIASLVYAPYYWRTVIWIAAKSTTLLSFITSGATISRGGLLRVDMDTPNLAYINAQNAYALKVLNYTGKYPANYSGGFMSGTMIDSITINSTVPTDVSSLFASGRNRSISLILRGDVAINYANICQSNTTIRFFSTAYAWGNFSAAVQNCYNLKEIDLSNCPVNGITNADAWTNLYSCIKILFPSYIDANGIRQPKSYAPGMTSMGPLNITNSGLNRSALVEMFRSLPANAVAQNLTITGSVGAADLTAEEIAVVTIKNWVVIR